MRFSIPFIFYIRDYTSISNVGALVVSTGYLFAVFIVVNMKKSTEKIASTSILLFTMPLCCLGNALSLQAPIVLDTAKVDSETFYLTGELEVFDSHAYSRLYKCNDITYRCERTRFFDGGGGAGFRDLHLMIDRTSSSDEIHVIYRNYAGFEMLDFTHGSQPRYYDYPAQLNNYLYYLARYNNNESKTTTYLLYECNLDNTSCKQLPIKYEGNGYLRDTIVDETTAEIKVYIDNEPNQDTLIFTWGKNPRCYVEGCEVAGNLK